TIRFEFFHLCGYVCHTHLHSFPTRRSSDLEVAMSITHGEVGYFREVSFFDKDVTGTATQARTAAVLTRLCAQVTSQFLAHALRFRLAVTAFQIRQYALE